MRGWAQAEADSGEHPGHGGTGGGGVGTGERRDCKRNILVTFIQQVFKMKLWLHPSGLPSWAEVRADSATKLQKH